MNEMRKDRRAPASLKVKYKSATVDDFIEQFGADVSRGGIFIKTKKPLDTGALLKFEFQLQGGAPVIHGVGRVAWRRLEDRARADLPAGMGIKFIKLDDQSRAVIDRIEGRHGPGSRFDQTEAAELAPPLSSLPPSLALNGATTPAPTPQRQPTPSPNARRFSGGLAAPDPAQEQPTFRPPPPATSSIPPALADAWPATPAKPPSRSAAPKGALGSFMSDPGPRKNTSIRSTARDTSEFLASAFSVGGAGHEVRSQARVQVERARRDPQSVDLANELFGDLSEPRSMGDSLNPISSEPPSMADLKPASDPKLPSPAERSLSDRIPSIEELVDEVTGAGSSPEHARRGNGAAPPSVPAGVLRGGPSTPPARSGTGASGPSAALRGSAAAPRVPGPSGAHKPEPPPAAATQPGFSTRAVAASARPAPGGPPHPELETVRPGSPAPLSLALSAPPPAAGAAGANAAPGGARNVMGFVFGGIALVALALAGFFFMQKPAPAPDPVAATGPQPSAAATEAPVAAAAKAPVEVSVTSEPSAAQLLVDGKPAGTTPATLDLTPSQAVELTVRSPGYASKTERVSPEAGMAPQHFVLETLPYELVITTTPPGANVRVNDLTATSPDPLKLGHIGGLVDASIEKEGFQRQTRAIRPDEFVEEAGVMRASVTLSLAPLPAPRRRAPGSALAPTAPPPAPSTGAPPEPGEEAAPPPPVMQVKPAAEPADEPAAAKPKAEATPAPPPAAPAPSEPPTP